MFYPLMKKSWCATLCPAPLGLALICFLSKECLFKWEIISVISHTFKLSVDDVELSIWEDEDVIFHILWAWHFPVNCKLNSFFRIPKSQSTCMKVIVSHTPEIDESLSHSLCCFPFQISWGPLPKYFLFPLLDCKPCSEFYPLLPSLQWCQDWMSSHCLQHRQHMACKKEVLSLTSLGHWCSHWSLCLIPYLLTEIVLSWVMCLYMNLFHLCG